MNPPSPFSSGYFPARARFRAAAARLGWTNEIYPIQAPGPNGEQLTVDVAIGPNPTANRTVVVSSGLHGVEGFFGSAVQVAWLEQQTPGQTGSVRFVFLHALNPHGFAWGRRYDERNVDPNRNFLLASERYEGSPPGYGELDSVLNPRRPPRRWESFKLRAGWEVFRRGMPAMKRIIMTGQHEYPRGVFYGGAGPSQSNEFLQTNLRRWVGDCRDVVHLDFHSGLGAWGTYKLLVDYPLNQDQFSKLTSLFGASTIEVCDAEGIAYSSRGDFGRWCVAQKFAGDYLFACAEFGTYGPITMLAGIRAENMAFHWGRPDSGSTTRARQRLKELFCPSDESWRSTVLAESLGLIDKAAKR
ncbi:MAG TPA: M14 family metallopeptidase [Fimbriiglobus sp.]